MNDMYNIPSGNQGVTTPSAGKSTPASADVQANLLPADIKDDVKFAALLEARGVEIEPGVCFSAESIRELMDDEDEVVRNLVRARLFSYVLPVTRETLYPDQLYGLSLLYENLMGGALRVVFQGPTGAGKTLLGGEITLKALASEGRVLFCVSGTILINQTIERFRKYGITDIGAIQQKHKDTNPKARVQVCSVQTLRSRSVKPKADVVIIDECHELHEFYKKWMRDPECKHVLFIGLSATPWSKGLGLYFDTLVRFATPRELIDKGRLSDFKVFAPVHPNLRGIKTVRGDYHERQLSELMQEAALVADLVATYKKLGEDRKGFIFCVDCSHAKVVRRQFEEAGIKCGYLDHKTKPRDREEVRKDYEAGQITLIANVGILTTGVDWDLRIIILARPTKSKILFVQMVGRGLRIAPGKDFLKILDHSDNHARLGFVDAINQDELDNGEKKLSIPGCGGETRECPECHYVMGRKLDGRFPTKCPECGHEFEKQAKDITIAPGELVEVSPPPPPQRRPLESLSDIELYGMLLHHVDTEGYKPGFAWHKFIELRRRTPPRDASMIPPCSELVQWLRGKRREFAQKMERDNAY